MRIGILTGGGDAPGLNAVIRGITIRAIQDGNEILGVQLGWKGMIQKLFNVLTLDDVEDIQRQGGTILGSSRTNPFKIEKGTEIIVENMKEMKMDALVAIGGEDTLGVANKLFKMGIKVIGVPKTIDNDVSATDYTFGFDTAINIATEAMDRLHTTAKSHHRVMIVEIMGRHAGWMALHAGIAGGAHIILIPEELFDINYVCDIIKKRKEQGKVYSMVAVAEGARCLELEEKVKHNEGFDAFGHIQLGKGIGIGEVLEKEIEKRTGIETRLMVLGHLQRGGAPSAFDRVLGTRFGYKAYDLIKQNKFGKMVSLKGTEIVEANLEEGVGVLKIVPQVYYNEAKVFFGL
ncbi:MAG: ATP-dependent 6-phosphofructokinase [bacterium]